MLALFLKIKHAIIWAWTVRLHPELRRIWLMGTANMTPSQRKLFARIIIVLIIFLIFAVGKGERGLKAKKRNAIRRSYADGRRNARSYLRISQRQLKEKEREEKKRRQSSIFSYTDEEIREGNRGMTDDEYLNNDETNYEEDDQEMSKFDIIVYKIKETIGNLFNRS